MELNDLISKDAILSCVKASSKKQLFQEISEKIATLTQLPARDIFDTLLQRERLGSTGIGNGLAIPHGKMDKIHSVFGFFARLSTPLEFEAVDDVPVDLVFVLLAPEGAGADHLKALARIARVMRTESMANKLRATRDVEALHLLLSQPMEETHAA